MSKAFCKSKIEKMGKPLPGVDAATTAVDVDDDAVAAAAAAAAVGQDGDCGVGDRRWEGCPSISIYTGRQNTQKY